MAHAFGSTVLARTSAATSPITRSATTASGDTVLVVMLNTVGATDRAGGALTFNGVTMTQADVTRKAASSPEAGAELWYLVNPDITTANLVIPNTGSLTIFSSAYTARAGAGKTSAFDVAAGSTATSANPTTGAMVTTVNGDAIFATTAGGWQTFAPSARTGTSLFETDDGANGGGGQYLMQGTAGSQAMDWTQASDDWGAVGASFKEVQAPIPAPVGTLSLVGQTLALALTVGLGVASLAFTGRAPNVNIGPNIAVPVGTLQFKGPARPPTAVSIPIGVGTLTTSGQTPSLSFTVPISAGTLAASGTTPNLADTRPIGVGTLSFSGPLPASNPGLTLFPGVGTLVFKGPAHTTSNVLSGISNGTLSFSGPLPSVLIDVPRAIGSGTLSFSGPSLALSDTWPIPAGPFAFTGPAPTRAIDAPFAIGSGTLALSGLSLSLADTRTIAQGPLVFTGTTPVVSVAAGGSNITLTPGVGTLLFKGPARVFSFSLTPAPATLGLTGQSLTATNSGSNPAIAIGVGTLALSGQTPVRLVDKPIPIGVGTLALTGQYLGQAFNWNTTGELVFTGYAPTIAIGGGSGVSRAPAQGTLVFTGTTLSLAFVRPVPVGTLAFTGQTPVANVSLTIAPNVGTLAFSGPLPTLLVNTILSPSVGVLTLTGPLAALSVSGTLPIALQALTFTGLAPTLTVGLPSPPGTALAESGNSGINGWPTMAPWWRFQ